MSKAKVVIQRVWPDGDCLLVIVRAETSYPDALDQAKRTALDAFAEGCGVVNTAVEE